MKKGEFVRNVARPDFREMLTVLGFGSRALATAACGAMSTAYDCVGDVTHRHWKPRGCREALCPFCSAARTRNLAEYVRYKIRSVYRQLRRPIRYIAYEFTMPYDLRRRVMAQGMKVYEKLVRETMEEYLSFGSSIQLAMVQVPQTWSTEDPMGKGPLPHVHGVLFSVGFDKVNQSILEIKVNRYGFEEDRGFKRLRKLWWNNLVKQYGTSTAHDVVVNFHYEKEGEHLSHRLRYMFRSPVHDVYEYVKAHGVPRDYDAGWMRTLLAERKRQQRMAYYGWIAPRNCSARSPFMKRFGVQFLKRTEYAKERRKLWCPTCGCLMEKALVPMEPTADVLARGESVVVVDRRKVWLGPQFLDGG